MSRKGMAVRATHSSTIRKLGWIVLWVISLYLVHLYSIASQKSATFMNNKVSAVRSFHEDQRAHQVSSEQPKELPLIFIGGMPRSGTTLMRTMLDAHPDIRCGQETRVIPRLLFMRNNWMRSSKEKLRLEEAGVLPSILNTAVRDFILDIIVNHGDPATYLCNKDPFTLKATTYLHELFPMAKFILMLRDGRATAHSIISRKVTIAGFDISSYRDVLTKWSRAMELIAGQCKQVGPSYCLRVHYEKLVLQPVSETKRIFQFLSIPWSENVLHHEKHLDDIHLSKTEKSTDQVQRPIYLDSLTSWQGKIPEDVEREMSRIAPMLSTLGYDPYNRRPSYGEPDEFIKERLKSTNSTRSR